MEFRFKVTGKSANVEVRQFRDYEDFDQSEFDDIKFYFLIKIDSVTYNSLFDDVLYLFGKNVSFIDFKTLKRINYGGENCINKVGKFVRCDQFTLYGDYYKTNMKGLVIHDYIRNIEDIIKNGIYIREDKMGVNLLSLTKV